MLKRVEPVDPKIYNRIFQQDRDGQAVLDELSRLYYDRPSYTKGDTHETAFKEGQRSVVSFLIHKCGLIQEDKDADNEEIDA